MTNKNHETEVVVPWKDQPKICRDNVGLCPLPSCAKEERCHVKRTIETRLRNERLFNIFMWVMILVLAALGVAEVLRDA